MVFIFSNSEMKHKQQQQRHKLMENSIRTVTFRRSVFWNWMSISFWKRWKAYKLYAIYLKNAVCVWAVSLEKKTYTPNLNKRTDFTLFALNDIVQPRNGVWQNAWNIQSRPLFFPNFSYLIFCRSNFGGYCFFTHHTLYHRVIYFDYNNLAEWHFIHM